MDPSRHAPPCLTELDPPGCCCGPDSERASPPVQTLSNVQEVRSRPPRRCRSRDEHAKAQAGGLRGKEALAHGGLVGCGRRGAALPLAALPSSSRRLTRAHENERGGARTAVALARRLAAILHCYPACASPAPPHTPRAPSRPAECPR
eukprot:6049775-Prymnesium_polylepis.2